MVMKLKQYIEASPRGAGQKLAEILEVSPSYLSQMATGKAPIPIRKAVLIERHTKRQVTREDMFEDWETIWPELKSRAKRRTRQEALIA